MANLVLKRFQCVEDTSESGGESPYFITWVGDLVDGTSTLKLTRKTYWDNNVSMGPGAGRIILDRAGEGQAGNGHQDQPRRRAHAHPRLQPPLQRPLASIHRLAATSAGFDLAPGNVARLRDPCVRPSGLRVRG